MTGCGTGYTDFQWVEPFSGFDLPVGRNFQQVWSSSGANGLGCLTACE